MHLDGMKMSPSFRDAKLPELPGETPHICVSVIGTPSCEFTVSTPGDSELAEGVGKSCLCSRFVLPSHDDYLATREDHQSSVPAISFHDREWASSHYLYFGSVVKRPCPSRQLVVFHVVEHTTLVDEWFTPHQGHEFYANRATASALTCSAKVSYLGKRFSGLQLDKRERFPAMFDGQRHCVGGYVLVLDPTRSEREIDQQIDLLRSCAQQIEHQRSPSRLALAITKCDAASSQELRAVREKVAESLGSISCFEVSARTGVAVDATFHYIYNAVAASMVDRNTPIVYLPYSTSAVARAKAESRAVERFQQTLRENIMRFDVTFREMTQQLVAKGQGEALAAVLSLRGKAVCKSIFRERLVEIKVAALQDAFKRELNAALVAHPDVGDDFKEDQYSRQCFPDLNLSQAVSLSNLQSPSNSQFSSRKTSDHERVDESALLGNSSSSEELSMSPGSEIKQCRNATQTVESNAYYSDAVIDILGPFGYSPPSATDRSLIAPHYDGGVQNSKALLRTLTGDGLWSFEPTETIDSSFHDNQSSPRSHSSAQCSVDPCYAKVDVDFEHAKKTRRAGSLPRGVPPLPPSPVPRRRLHSMEAGVSRPTNKLRSPRPFCLLQKNSATSPPSPPFLLSPSSDANAEQEPLQPLKFLSPCATPPELMASPSTLVGGRACHSRSRSSPLRMSKAVIEQWDRSRLDNLATDVSGYLTPAELINHHRKSPEAERGSPGMAAQDNVPDEEQRLSQDFQVSTSPQHMHDNDAPLTAPTPRPAPPLTKRNTAPIIATNAKMPARSPVNSKSVKAQPLRKEAIYAEVGPPNKPQNADAMLARPFSALHALRHKREFASSPNLRAAFQAAPRKLPSLPQLIPMDGSPVRRRDASDRSSLGGSPTDESEFEKDTSPVVSPDLPMSVITAGLADHGHRSAFRPVHPQARMAFANPAIGMALQVPEENEDTTNLDEGCRSTSNKWSSQAAHTQATTHGKLPAAQVLTHPPLEKVASWPKAKETVV